MKKISAAVAAVLVSGVMATTAITTAPAYAQDRRPVAATASAAGSWHFTGGLYAAKSACVDDGQEYQREGFPYQCRYAYFPSTNQYLYWLFIYN
ncbi:MULTISPECIES: hypothetical protein [unclassified Streptomyces]|uniref:hypothetical protein n=1 Tax=unclassified Streptomyces TaxID=2593676 RepID=UPI00203446C6|nr:MULTISPECIES: hypothetical protein [unclassified Streptomyces]MCM2418768.1 hypothetical protein [Streptomyces sp. RKAG293]MCM2429043.1 hypothetical protein [Streptomyces sp. RKAG337]